MRGLTKAMLAALLGSALVVTPAAAEFFGCKDPKVSVRYVGGAANHYASAGAPHEFAAQSSRPRITIYPRRAQLSPNSVRQCRAQLVKEYRVSGTVIVPRTTCWWE